MMLICEKEKITVAHYAKYALRAIKIMSTPSQSSLRDRRRLQTLRDIQLATLRLISTHGLDQVSTEMIADEAGISRRTFFNYYANKEAAALGPPLEMDKESAERFSASNGPLVEDLAWLLSDLIGINDTNRVRIRAISDAAERHPALRRAFLASREQITRQIADLLEARLGPDSAFLAQVLAELSARIEAHAFSVWSHDEAMSLDDVVDYVATEMRRLGAALRS